MVAPRVEGDFELVAVGKATRPSVLVGAFLVVKARLLVNDTAPGPPDRF